jgi:anti-sigma factor RsiW
MMEINDEILNSYFDGDLSAQDKAEVLKSVNNSPGLRRKFDSLKQANDLLLTMKADEVSENFASMVLSKLNAQKIRVRQQKRFLTIIISFFGVIILTITGFVLYNILISASQSTETSTSLTALSNYVKDLSSLLFSKNGTTIIGSAISFIMLVSGYFLFEYQKKMKSNPGK